MPETYVNVYDQIGEREDLINLVTSISPEETVTMSRLGRANAKSFKHDWLTQALAAADSANAIIDGASATFASSDYTARVSVTNYTQILRRVFSSSYSQEAIVQAGVSSEFANQRELKTKEVKRDANSALINQTSASGTSAVARRVNGVLAAITTNTRDGGGKALEQILYNDLLQSIWDQGGHPNVTYCGGFQKRVISNWTPQGGQRWTDAEGRKIINTIDTYSSDFGMQTILLERNQPAAQISLLEEKYWRIAWLRPLFYEELSKVGEQHRGSVVMELTLEYLAENSSGKITALATQ